MSFEFSGRAFRAGSSVLMVLCSSQLEGTRAQDAAAIGVPQFAEEESPESRHRAGAVGQRRTGGAKRRELMEEVEQVDSDDSGCNARRSRILSLGDMSFEDIHKERGRVFP